MDHRQHITLYTSIPPGLHRVAAGFEYGDAYQRECIESWISGGFSVVSINRKAEIACLADKYPQVRFEDSGSENARTRINVFLEHIAAVGEPFSGIINADCYLLSPFSIAEKIRTDSQDSIVLLRRLNIDRATLRPTVRNPPGFDGFLFATKFLPHVDSRGNWAIGMPWWDFWFPVAMYLAGARIRMFDAPVLLHLEHDQRWHAEESDNQAAMLWDELTEHHRKMMGEEGFSQNPMLCGVDLSDETRKLEQLKNCIVPWLRLQAETIRLSSSGAAGNFLGRVLMGLEESQEESLRHQLETVTFARWLRSKRDAARRLRDRIHK